MAGGALDYWKAIKIKASYQQAAESAALAGSRLLQKFLFEIAPTDAATYAGARVLLGWKG